MEEELLGRNTSQGPVTQGVVELAVFLQLSPTTPSVAEDEDAREVIRSTRSGAGITVVDINLSGPGDQSPAKSVSSFNK